MSVVAGIVSTYPPRRCGLATFARDLRRALQGSGLVSAAPVAAMEPTGDPLPYPREVVATARGDVAETYREAARILVDEGCQVLAVQHEYGIFGGEDGRHVLTLLEASPLPVVTTLHTVRTHPTASQRSILRALVERSAGVVVMSRRAVPLLAEVYGVEADKVTYIPHGVPAAAGVDRRQVRQALGWEGRFVFLTFGLISPGKGLEMVLDALSRLGGAFRHVLYVVAGQTHPEVRRLYGETYREGLIRATRSLGLQDQVRFVDRYLDDEELVRYVVASDAVITPYPGAEQITSGTLTYAVGLGRVVISTPYRYAEEMLADGRGILVPFGDAAALADAMAQLVTDVTFRRRAERRIQALAQELSWPSVGERHARLLAQVGGERRRAVQGGPER